ncbi:Hypothetical Protein FCC1311_010092 [Hondaea fermentalgiana]|uniref:Uncharacterized protein n=1 Tax=Hondaea fermentalgiana TaxID=2315210 RepID=A0A2R5G9P1_9STRA|nr:Hypothetical Protein FCC1311_010092 [Hondaea fermentalgiana]|eukprot:GBG24791.1 Hypothetical Protein FCC1311_010092 [Hondaea fermentalgiana]
MRGLLSNARIVGTFLVVLLFNRATLTSGYDLNALGWEEIKDTLAPYGWDWDESDNKFTMNVTRGGVRMGEELLNRLDLDGAEYRTVDAGKGEVMLTKNGCKVFSIKKRLTWRAMFFGVLVGALLAIPTALFAGPIAGKLAGGKLNGAAASSHALAYFGSWVGGGMTAGSVLLTSLAGAFGAVFGAITNLSYVLSCQ